MLVNSPANAPVEPPNVEALDAGVIEDARGRQRRHRLVGAAAVLAAIVLAVAAYFGAGGTVSP